MNYDRTRPSQNGSSRSIEIHQRRDQNHFGAVGAGLQSAGRGRRRQESGRFRQRRKRRIFCWLDSNESFLAHPQAPYSTGMVAAGFTSTVMNPETVHEAAILDEDVVRYSRIKKKGKLWHFSLWRKDERNSEIFFCVFRKRRLRADGHQFGTAESWTALRHGAQGVWKFHQALSERLLQPDSLSPIHPEFHGKFH